MNTRHTNRLSDLQSHEPHRSAVLVDQRQPAHAAPETRRPTGRVVRPSVPPKARRIAAFVRCAIKKTRGAQSRDGRILHRPTSGKGRSLSFSNQQHSHLEMKR